MNQSKLNPLQQELAQATLAGPHPDFDVLAAFAESALPEPERQQVMAHLASCADCRELLSVASGAAEEPAAGLKPFLVARPARPPLREWLPWVSIAAGLVALCAAGFIYKQKPEPQEHATVASENTSRSAPAPNTEGGERPRSTPQTVGQPKSAFTNAQPARSFAQDAATLAVRSHWRINSTGHAERAVGDGAWETVLPGETARMHVVSVFNDNVWIGGENTRLYHSVDNGATWIAVILPEKNGNGQVISHVQFETAKRGTVEAADGTQWTTDDGGLTWR